MKHKQLKHSVNERVYERRWNHYCEMADITKNDPRYFELKREFIKDLRGSNDDK